MNRWTWFAICLVTGAVLVVAGLLIPAHLRAVDSSVLEAAAKRSHVRLEPSDSATAKEPSLTSGAPLIETVIQTDERERLLTRLQSSPRREVQALLKIRALTNTVLFSPSASSSG